MEKNYTIDTAYRLEAILRAAGLKTVLTRRTDVFVDLYERAHIASLYPDYAFVSIHYNSATPEARGLETYCLSPRGAASTSSNYLTRSDIQKLPGNDYDAANIVLAAMVHAEIIRLNPGDPTADRGVKRARFVVIKQNVLPAILVEGGFVSNRMEAARVNRPDYRQSLAEAIARGVIRFANAMGNRRLELPETISEDNPPPSAPPRALPVTPPAPSGLASELPKTHVKSQNQPPTVASQSPTGTTPSTHKKKLKKTAKAKTPAPGSAIVADPPATTPPASHAPSNETPSGPLNLSEPKAPAPSPNAEKAPPEPDEPPTVNIYPTTPTQPSNPPASPAPGPDNSAAKKTTPAPPADNP
jgi:N-acetylmuramoyl-L-alanine amidase